MSIKKQISCISYCNWSTGIGIWNETPQLICQYSIVPSQQFKIVMQKAKLLVDTNISVKPKYRPLGQADTLVYV